MIVKADEWPVVRARFMFREVTDQGYNLPLASVTKAGGVEFRSDLDISVWNPAEDISKYKRVKPGDFVIGLRSFQSGLGYSALDGLVSPAYTVLRPLKLLVAGFYKHYFKSDRFISQLNLVSSGIRQGRTINTDDFYNLTLPLPPDHEQRSIADFLDAETARIDKSMVLRRTLIELVQERTEAFIRDKLSESGPWRPLKRHWQVLDCKHRTPAYLEAGYPVVGPRDIAPGRLDLSRCQRYVGKTDLTDLTEGRKPRRGDLIYSRNASLGVAAFVGTDEAFCLGQDVCLLKSEKNDQRFLMYVLNCLVEDQLEEMKVGATFSRINVADIQELRVPIPSPELQKRLADELDEVVQSRDHIVNKMTHQVELLGERRIALITAAVTGRTVISAA